MTRWIALLLCGVGAVAQPKLAFEVASIKPVPRPTPETIQAGTARVGFEVDGVRVQIFSHSPLMVIAKAFGVELAQIDARNFVVAELFEIQARIPAGATAKQIPEMLQTMLAERFKLAYHRETREYPATVMTVGKSGMKLQRLPDGTPETSKSARLADGAVRLTSTGTVASLFPVMNSFGGFPQMVDETGLEGMYTWVLDQLPAAPGISYRDRVRESFEAMIEAAGLKLEARKVQRETIVVDHLEKIPTEN